MNKTLTVLIVATLIVSAFAALSPTQSLDGKTATAPRYQIITGNTSSVEYSGPQSPAVVTTDCVLIRLDTWTGKTWRLALPSASMWFEVREQGAGNE